jgi:anti-sigma factor RsiW
MADEREVAGTTCGEVLAELSDYLDGELSLERRAQLEAHLQGCDVCERFGGRFEALIQAIRRQASSPSAEEPAVFERLRAYLDRALGGRARD